MYEQKSPAQCAKLVALDAEHTLLRALFSEGHCSLVAISSALVQPSMFWRFTLNVCHEKCRPLDGAAHTHWNDSNFKFIQAATAATQQYVRIVLDYGVSYVAPNCAKHRPQIMTSVMYVCYSTYDDGVGMCSWKIQTIRSRPCSRMKKNDFEESKGSSNLSQFSLERSTAPLGKE